MWLPVADGGSSPPRHERPLAQTNQHNTVAICGARLLPCNAPRVPRASGVLSRFCYVEYDLKERSAKKLNAINVFVTFHIEVEGGNYGHFFSFVFRHALVKMR